MKVGMDGSLLGSWAGQGTSPKRILDIGTGTGLIALMCAQRFPEAKIDAIDIQSECLGQAQENVDDSPFSEQIKLHASSLQDFQGETYDLIVCNPPFFKNSSKTGRSDRDTARHDDSLPFEELAEHSARLLNTNGVLSLIIPEDRASEFMMLVEKNGLHLRNSMKVFGRVGGVAKRRMLEFSPTLPKEAPELKEMAVEADVKVWTEEYKDLLRDFYIVL